MNSAIIVLLVIGGLFLFFGLGFGGASKGLYSGGKKLNKKLGLVSLIIMLLGILGLTNLVNPLL